MGVTMGHLDLDRTEATVAICRQQQFSRAPLVEHTYYMAGEDYYDDVGMYLEEHDLSEKSCASSKEDMKGKIIQTLAVNLSQIQRQKKIQLNATKLISEFRDITQTVCIFNKHGSMVIGYDGKNITRPNENVVAMNDYLMICHPQRHLHLSENDPGNSRDIRAKFFAYFLEKDLLTEEQVEKSGALLGEDAQRLRQHRPYIANRVHPDARIMRFSKTG